MHPDAFFEIQIEPTTAGVVVSATHIGTDLSASIECGVGEVGRAKSRLKQEIIAGVLGGHQDVRFSVGRGLGGDITFAEHLPSHTRTKTHRRRDLVGGNAALLEELMTLVVRAG